MVRQRRTALVLSGLAGQRLVYKSPSFFRAEVGTRHVRILRVTRSEQTVVVPEAGHRYLPLSWPA